MLSVPSDHRRAKLACPSRPSFLFHEQRMPSKRELTPPLCTLNQPLPFANFCFFQKKTKPVTDPSLSGSERPRLQSRGNGSSITEGRAPPSLLAPFAPPSLRFWMGLRMCRCWHGPLPGAGQLGTEPKGSGGAVHPGCCLRGAAGGPRHRWQLGTWSWHHLRCHWQPGPAH